MRFAFVNDRPDMVARIYKEKERDAIRSMGSLDETVYTREMVLQNPEKLRDVEAVFSTWGIPDFTEEELKSCFPNLRYVFYGAGSVQRFAQPYLNLGIRVFSAWKANAVPVAEFAAAQIILGQKGYFNNCRLVKQGRYEEGKTEREAYPGNFRTTVGILGVGEVGRHVIRLLKNYDLSIKVYDPFLAEDTAEQLGVKKCSLEELFSTCTAISNHLANKPEIAGLLNGTLFRKMPYHSVFINTGRGAQVVEADLVAVLQERPDITAFLDVTWPEPSEKGHPFYSLPNCIMTPHMAGSMGPEQERMSLYMAEECRRLLEGKQPQYEVTEQMLKTMA